MFDISVGVCSFVNGSAHCSGCVIDGPSAATRLLFVEKWPCTKIVSTKIF